MTGSETGHKKAKKKGNERGRYGPEFHGNRQRGETELGIVAEEGIRLCQNRSDLAIVPGGISFSTKDVKDQLSVSTRSIRLRSPVYQHTGREGMMVPK
jgi:hypothetical protein